MEGIPGLLVKGIAASLFSGTLLIVLFRKELSVILKKVMNTK